MFYAQQDIQPDGKGGQWEFLEGFSRARILDSVAIFWVMTLVGTPNSYDYFELFFIAQQDLFCKSFNNSDFYVNCIAYLGFILTTFKHCDSIIF